MVAESRQLIALKVEHVELISNIVSVSIERFDFIYSSLGLNKVETLN